MKRHFPFCSIICLLVLACGTPSTSPGTSEVVRNSALPSGLDANTWRDIAAYPNNTTTVTAFPNPKRVGFLVLWLRSLAETNGWPACVGQQLDTIDRYYALALASAADEILVPTSVDANVFYGRFQRDEVTRCAQQSLSQWLPGTSAGARELTPELTALSDGSLETYLRWSQQEGLNRAVASSHPSAIKRFASDAERLAPSSQLVRLIGAVDRTRDVWSASTLDYASNALGVASTGYHLSMTFTGNLQEKNGVGIEGTGHVYFDSAASAERAKAAFEEFARGMSEPSIQKLFVDALTASAEGNRLKITVAIDSDQFAALMSLSAQLAAPSAGSGDSSEEFKWRDMSREELEEILKK